MFPRCTAALVAVVASVVPVAAADLDEARHWIESGRPRAALRITDAALAENPHDPVAHALRLRALSDLQRTREAIPDLDAWAAEAREDPRPLRILVGAYAVLFDRAGLVSVRERSTTVPEGPRRDLLRALASAQLRAGLWRDAADTLAVTPAATGDTPEDRMFRTLETARRGDDAEVRVLLGSNPELHDAEKGEFPWWITKMLDLAPPRGPEGRSPDAAAPAPTEFANAGGDGPDVVLPVLLRQVEPVYPAQASAKRLQGKVTLEAVILQSGRIASVKVLESTNPIFNDAARRAILRWRYSPATVDGKPVAVYFTIVVDFKLKRSKKK